MAGALDLPISTDTDETLIGVSATATSCAAALSCAACCVLPLALPAALLAGTGATLGWLESASPWLRLLSVVVVAAAWLMIWRKSVRTGKKAARSTMILLGVSTVLTAALLLWEPYFEVIVVDFLR